MVKCGKTGLVQLIIAFPRSATGIHARRCHAACLRRYPHCCCSPHVSPCPATRQSSCWAPSPTSARLSPTAALLPFIAQVALPPPAAPLARCRDCAGHCHPHLKGCFSLLPWLRSTSLPPLHAAEIVLGTVTNIREAVQWLGYTYMYTRMVKNPLVYGLTFAVRCEVRCEVWKRV